MIFNRSDSQSMKYQKFTGCNDIGFDNLSLWLKLNYLAMSGIYSNYICL